MESLFETIVNALDTAAIKIAEAKQAFLDLATTPTNTAEVATPTQVEVPSEVETPAEEVETQVETPEVPETPEPAEEPAPAIE